MSNSESTAMTLKELLQSIADNKKGGTRYAFLLGAGASISSGIPGAKTLASGWLEEIKDNNTEGYQKLTEHRDYDPENIAALYTEVYQTRFQNFPGDGYREIEKIMSAPKVQPSIGYSILAQVMSKTRHNLVLTTNFDRLTETALLSYQNVHARVIAHETMLDVAAIDDQHPSIAKVHRDMFFSPMSTGLGELNDKWPAVIKDILRQYEVVAIGYGGNDGGLMDVLEKALEENSNARIYWCYRDKPTGRFGKFAEQVVPVKITSFDEMMFVLGKKLGYPLLSDQFIKVAKKRKQAYEAQIGKLVSKPKTDTNREVTDAISKLVASTWWEVELGVQEEKDLNEKEALYKEGLKKFPNSHQLWGNFALFLNEVRKDYDQAERYYKKALVAAPDDANYNGNYALFLNEVRKDYDQAEQYYKRALATDPDHANNNGNYASFLNEVRKDYDQAERYYKKALVAAPDDANHNGNYALFLNEVRKDYDQAEQYYKRALAADPDHANINVNYASFLKEVRKDYDQAEQYYKKALELKPEHGNINGNYALFLKEVRKDYDQAEQYYKKALAADPDHANINVNYALFLNEVRKDYDQAEQYYKKALAAAPDDANINGNYALFLNRNRNDYNEAEQYYKKALAAAPDDANINGNYAGFLLAGGRTVEATPFLERAEKFTERKDLELEVHFYRLAHFPETEQDSRRAIDVLLEQGVRSPGWDFSRNIERAEQEGCPYVDDLREIAKKISEVE